MVACLTALLEQAARSSPYDYTIIAQTGQNGFTGFGDRPSINNKGTVAFVGQVSGGEALVIGKGGGAPPQNISANYLSSSGRFFSRATWINDQDQLAGYERLNPNFTHIRLWQGANGFTTFAEGGPSATEDQYDIIYDSASINNAGQIVFAACPRGSSSTTALVTQFGNVSNVLVYPFSNPIFRPAIADSGHVVVRAGSQVTSPIHRYVYDLTTGIEIANTSMGFTQIGRSPGITDDGSIVAFAGDRGNGQGIFVSLEDSFGSRMIVRIAGENQTELGTDDQGQPLYFSSINVDDRVAVIRDELGDSGLKDDNIIVCFVGTPNAASGTNNLTGPKFTSARGLWTVRLSVTPGSIVPNALEFAPVEPLPVIQIGDTIKTDASPLVVDNFSVFDPLARGGDAAATTQNVRLGDHRLAFWASAGSDQLIVRAARKNIHVVLLMMENRSFDHLLGWLPGAEGRQSGLTYSKASGQSFSTWPLAPHFQGCGCNDPDHSYGGGRTEFNNGACDGWLRANANDTFSIGYYVQNDLSFLGQVAPKWTVCDRYFSAVMAETQPNRIYQHAAQTDKLVNRDLCSPSTWGLVEFPTIWDRLAANGVEGRYYCGTGKFDNFLHLWGPLSGPLFGYKYDSISLPISQFYQDCAAGTLPAVSFVDPVFTFFNCFDRETPGNDDHPHADIRNGEQFMASIYNAVISSPNWPNTILIINFDEWGGFFDHVAPTVAEVPQQEQAAYADVGIQPTNPTYGLRGFRVPCLVISPWARRGHVAHQEFDHTSVLKLIENRWRLPPLTVRDQNANDLADVLDFDHPDFTPPTPVMPPLGPWGGPCMELRTERRADGSLLIIWDHDTTCWRIMLQTAPEMRGPWMDIPSATSPFTVNPATSQHWFRFRVL